MDTASDCELELELDMVIIRIEASDCKCTSIHVHYVSFKNDKRKLLQIKQMDANVINCCFFHLNRFTGSFIGLHCQKCSSRDGQLENRLTLLKCL